MKKGIYFKSQPLKFLFIVFLILLFLIVVRDCEFQNLSHPQYKMSITDINQKNYRNFWYRSTFPTIDEAILYHTAKHGRGRTSLQYTKDAVYFYDTNQNLRRHFFLKDGSPGYKIKKGEKGGIWTKEGKIVTFWG